MANELCAEYPAATGATIYFTLRLDGANTIWNGTSLVSVSSATWTACAIAATEASTKRVYYADFPAGLTTVGVYTVTARKQVGGSPAVSDPIIGIGSYVPYDIPADAFASGVAQAGATSTITLAADAPSFTVPTSGGYVYIYLVGGTGKGQVAKVSAYNATTKVATICGVWLTTPDSTSRYYVLVSTYDRTVLDSAGVDTITVESGLNARQALAVVAAGIGGTCAGMDSQAPIFKGAGVSTTRISATTDQYGNRSAVTLSPPA